MLQRHCLHCSTLVLPGVLLLVNSCTLHISSTPTSPTDYAEWSLLNTGCRLPVDRPGRLPTSRNDAVPRVLTARSCLGAPGQPVSLRRVVRRVGGASRVQSPDGRRATEPGAWHPLFDHVGAPLVDPRPPHASAQQCSTKASPPSAYRRVTMRSRWKRPTTTMNTATSIRRSVADARIAMEISNSSSPVA